VLEYQKVMKLVKLELFKNENDFQIGCKITKKYNSNK